MTMIYIPKRHIEVEMLPPAIGLKGRFLLQKFKGEAERGGALLAEREFPNLITNLGLDRFGNFACDNLYTAFHVGTGTAIPQVTDTALQSYLAGMGSSQFTRSRSVSGSAPYKGMATISTTFAVGAVVGNLTEIGMSRVAANTSELWSRALILDAEGNPTTFPVLADEQLVVTYVLECVVPTADAVASVNIAGVGAVDTITRAHNATNAVWAPVVGNGFANVGFTQSNAAGAYTGDITDVTGTPSGFLGSSDSSSNAAYGSGNLYRDGAVVFGPGSFNNSLRSCVFFGAMGAFQTQYDPVIPKNNLQTLTLNFRFAWARA
ncbi:hypothetical protein ACHZ97_14270 [Lysobacter soli]|uniref:hypothetical protein n=1 Tax=Lysobacter soli TaxID=453783 RepID=UPI0037C84965